MRKIFATDKAFPALVYCQLQHVTSYAFLYSHPIHCQLKPGVGGKKKIDLSLCHWGPALPEQVIAADLASVCLVQTKAYLFSSPHLWCFLPVLIKYGSSRLVLYNLCATGHFSLKFI